MDDLVKQELLEQLLTGIVLGEAKLDSGKRLALIVIDNSVELSLKFYARHNSLKKPQELDNISFHGLLELIAGKGVLKTSDKLKLESFHNTRNDLYHGVSLTTVNGKTIGAYAEEALKLLNDLYGLSFTPDSLARSARKMKSTAFGERLGIKPLVFSEKVNVGELNALKLKFEKPQQKTDVLLLLLRMFPTHYGDCPTIEQIRRSLMLSDANFDNHHLDVVLSSFRKKGYMEKTHYALKVKGRKLIETKYELG